MSQWPATRARRVLAALLRVDWRIKRQSGSHRIFRGLAGPISCLLSMTEEIGPKMLSRIAKHTGLKPDDL